MARLSTLSLLAALLLLLLGFSPCSARRLLVTSEAQSSATGRTAAASAQSVATSGAGFDLGTVHAIGTALDGSVATHGAVTARSGSGLAVGTTKGFADGTTSTSESAITGLTNPTTAAIGGFTSALAAGPAGLPATADTLTRLVAATSGSLAAGTIGSHATSTVGGAALSHAAGLAQAGPAGTQVTGNPKSHTPTATRLTKLHAIGDGDLAQALAELLSAASSTPTASLADALASGSSGAGSNAQVDGASLSQSLQAAPIFQLSDRRLLQ